MYIFGIIIRPAPPKVKKNFRAEFPKKGIDR